MSLVFTKNFTIDETVDNYINLSGIHIKETELKDFTVTIKNRLGFGGGNNLGITADFYYSNDILTNVQLPDGSFPLTASIIRTSAAGVLVTQLTSDQSFLTYNSGKYNVTNLTKGANTLVTVSSSSLFKIGEKVYINNLDEDTLSQASFDLLSLNREYIIQSITGSVLTMEENTLTGHRVLLAAPYASAKCIPYKQRSPRTDTLDKSIANPSTFFSSLKIQAGTDPDDIAHLFNGEIFVRLEIVNRFTRETFR